MTKLETKAANLVLEIKDSVYKQKKDMTLPHVLGVLETVKDELKAEATDVHI